MLLPLRGAVTATALIALVMGACTAPAASDAPLSAASPGPTVAPTASVTSGPSALATATTTPLPAAPGFTAGESFKVGADPGNVAVADLNADGSLDLVTASAYFFADATPGTESKGEISILLGQGDGTFSAPVSVAGPKADLIAAVDLDGDGTPDLVAAGGSAVSVLIGKGDGAFGEPVSYQVQGDLAYAEALWLDTGDLDGDAAPDLLVSVYGYAGPSPSAPGQLAVLLNKGDGTFADAVFYPDRAAVAVVGADFDGDGNLDAATANFDGTVRVFAGDGNGRLGAPTEYGIGAQGAAIVAGDLDRDGSPDLLTGNDASNSVSVLIGKGDGSFSEAQTLPAGNTHTVALADLDDDGNVDLLAGGYTSNEVRFWRGAGDGTFVTTAGVDIGDATAKGVAAADFNGGGKLDLAVVDVVTSIHIFLAE